MAPDSAMDPDPHAELSSSVEPTTRMLQEPPDLVALRIIQKPEPGFEFSNDSAVPILGCLSLACTS